MSLPNLSFGGLVIVGKCTKCTLYIWGPKGTPERTEHGYCGVTINEVRR